MAIWTVEATPAEINERMKGTMGEFLDLQVTEIGDDYVKGTLPVNEKTQQHMGIIHGGANVVLAETLGSIGSTLCCKPGFFIVGLDINANHVRAGRPPYLTGIAKPAHIGNSTMVWEINIYDTEDKLVCVSRLTTAVLKDRD